MTWHEFIELVEADGVTPETILASVHWTARTGLVVQAQPDAAPDALMTGEGIPDTHDPGTPYVPAPESVYTKRNDLGEVDIHN